MIISKTPLRVSFCGGGSDLPSFYKKQMGAVVSTSIDKYIYIAVNKRFEDSIRVSYSITEIARNIESIRHELVRECLFFAGVTKRVEIVSIADIPSKGTGLGSSSAYVVGLLNALHAYKKENTTPKWLAEEACYIEMFQCKKPIGKQDQYAVAHGGFNYIQFNLDGSVIVEPIKGERKIWRKLQKNLIMFYTGMTRPSGKILKEQSAKMGNDVKRENVSLMADLAKKMKVALEDGDLSGFGRLLDMNWELKRSLVKGISNSKIDGWYKVAKRHGAIGGKVLGAGGGGFLLIYAPLERHRDIAKALPELKRTPFRFESGGSRIIHLSS